MKTQAKPIAAKWKTALAGGFTALPNVLIRQQHELGLTPLDFCILTFLASFWWEEHQPAFPSKDTIASALGVHRTTVRRRIASLEKRGFLRRIERRVDYGSSRTNAYLLDGLVDRACELGRRRLISKASKNATLSTKDGETREAAADLDRSSTH